MNKVAVVILNYNGKKFLEQFLPFVLQFSSGHEIIVGDNGSTDNSIDFLEQNFPTIRVIKLPANEGFSKGYNLVLRQVEAQYYVLLNSDVEVTPNWVDPVISLMDSDPDIAACQPKILSYDQKDTFEYAGAAGGFIDKFGYPFCRGRIFDTIEKDTGQYDDVTQIFWATGACLFIRSDVFHQFNGFDDYFFAHMEEIDLCWRINKAGYKIMYTSHSKVYHIGGGTLPKTNPRKTFLNFRNSLFMLYKNLGPVKRNRLFFLRVLMDTLAVIKFLTSGQKEVALAVLKAYMHFFKNLKKVDRKFSLDKKEETPNLPIYNGSIIASYFFKKKKKFSSLYKGQ